MRQTYRKIVQALQGGESRAEYGRQVIEDLSVRLSTRYSKGFSTTNLWYFRQFYQVYSDCLKLSAHPLDQGSGPANTPPEILHPPGGESVNTPVFHPNLSWPQYRAPMRVENDSSRAFYETEAARSNWSRRDLERRNFVVFPLTASERSLVFRRGEHGRL